MAVDNISIWVSAGSFEAPYYRFYADEHGSQELSNLVLDTSKSYTFRRLNEATSHPFYLSDIGFKEESSSDLVFSGHGSANNGIVGAQQFTVRFADTANDVQQVYYYCSSHSSMFASFEVEGKEDIEPIVRGTSLYAIIEGPSWTEAEANSVKLGGHLVSIQNSQENNFILEILDVQSMPIGWIGYKDDTGGGDGNDWKWVNGEVSEYENWNTNRLHQPGHPEPNDTGIGRSTYAEMYGTAYDQLQGGSQDPGTWNDTINNDTNSGERGKGVAEIPFIRRGDSAYVIVKGPTWEEAEANANTLGGHLVAINDIEENEWLVKTFKDSGKSYEESGEDIYHIGLFRDSALAPWKWSNGEEVAYMNFGPGEPYNEKKVAAMNTFGQDQTSQAPSWNWASVSGSWVDGYGVSGKHGRLPGLYGIAEIPLAPNIAPTGTPTLSGEFKVGQTIIIDTSAMQDADNHEYWTPTYEYSWEVSGDRGTTWTELTSADATDGDDSFTITSAEIGKQLRGVVSYLDGHGTYESLFSDAVAGTAFAGPVIRGSSLYVIASGSSWNTARVSAEKLGGSLASIEDGKENKFIFDHFGYDPETGKTISSGYWIGFTDQEQEGKWKWISGSHSQWMPSDFRPGVYGYEPNGNGDHAWVKSGFDLTRQGLPMKSREEIESTAGDLFLNEGPGWDDTWESGQGTNYGVAEIPFIRRGDSAYVIVKGPTWEEAEANAIALGGHLVTINDAGENDWIVKNYLTQKNRNYFIGATDQGSEGRWMWTSGEKFEYSNWYAGEPSNADGGEHYSIISGAINDAARFGFWNDTKGLSSEFGIAEIPLAPNSFPLGSPVLSGSFKVGQAVSIDASSIEDADNFEGWIPAYKYSWEIAEDPGMTTMMPMWESLDTPDATDGNETLDITDDLIGKLVRGVVSYVDGYGSSESLNSDASVKIEAQVKQPIIRGNSLYTIVDGYYWHESEEISRQLGGNLVTINNAQEDAFVLSAFSDSAVELAKARNQNYLKTNLHIGLNDLQQEGVWTWASGQEVDYTNWQSGEPANGTEGNHAGILVNWWSEGKWHDLYDSYIRGDEANVGIAEIPFVRRGDSAYVIVQGPTWEEAEANANALGGHLVTINDAEENEWILDTYTNDTNNAYIGYSDKDAEGFWGWSSGDQSTFTNWNFGEPNNSRYSDGVDEDYALIHLWQGGPLGSWNDGREYGVNYGIAEIKLAPNNTPTGTPTLSGTTKVGQVITIDRTPIQDADNFTGYTPDFKYTWEITEDPGMTTMLPMWESLDTPDATDGDETLEITDDLIGKLVRGVVSYVDGYGTNEEMRSAPNDIPAITPVTLTVGDITGSPGQIIAVPIIIDRQADQIIQAIDLVFKFDPALLELQSPLVSAGELTQSWGAPVANANNGSLAVSLASASPLADSTGEILFLNFRINNDANDPIAIDLDQTQSLIQEGEIDFTAIDGTIAINQAPTNLSVSGNGFDENIAAGSLIALLSTTDQDIGDTHTYSFVSGDGDDDNIAFSISGDQLLIKAIPDYESQSSYNIRLASTDANGLSVEKAFNLTVNDRNDAPTNLSVSGTSFDENIAAGSLIALLSTTDQDIGDIHTYSFVSGDGDADNTAFSISGDQLLINAVPDYEIQSSYKIRLASTDANGLSVEKAFSLTVNDITERIVSLTPDATSVAAGGLIAIPIAIDDATDLQSFDLTVNVDPTLFEAPATVSLAESGELNGDWTVTANLSSSGSIAISGFSPIPLASGSGSIAVLNLKAKDYAVPGTGSIDLFAASLNEARIGAEMFGTSVEVTPASFQVFEVSAQPYGLAVRLSSAPDLDAFNLYDGQDTSIDAPDLLLSDADGNPVALSAHWQEDSMELLLLSDEPLDDGDYTLEIDSRADGLISAASGELLDGDGDGTAGDALSTTISVSSPEHSLSIANTARGAGQSLNLNGANTHDPVTGLPLDSNKGLPIHLSTTSSLTAFSGQLSYDSSLLINNQLESVLSAGADLPADWTVQIDSSSTPGSLQYSASGSTPITGEGQQILRFNAEVTDAAAPPARGTTGNGLYGSSTLIHGSFSSDQITGESIAIDPGLIALAYAGDTTGNGTLSSLDASHIQRVVVRLDSGFDAYDSINPVLISDTTGNGSLSSLDASRIQQQVVGLDVHSFPDIPQL